MTAVVALFSQLLSTFSCFAQTDSLQKFIINDVTIIGNKITKPHIITRELTFHKGDTLTFEEFENKRIRSEQNVTNTSLFNSVNITYVVDTPQHAINTFIILKERWYIFPLPIFEIVERNFNVWWKDKDFSRIVYGGVLYWYNFRGRAETVSLAMRFGYTRSVSFSYSIPYVNKKQTSGLSFGFAYLRNHQISYRSFDNNPVYYKDSVHWVRQYYSGAIQYSYRRGLYHRHYLTAERIYAHVEDTIIRLNNEFFGKPKSTQRYFSLRYFFRNDHRDYVVYPLHGYEYDIEIVKNGFPFFNDDVNFAFLTFNYRKYFELGHRFYFATRLRGKVTDGSFIPYFNTSGLGYGNDYIRGYEYFVIDGQQFGLVKANLKYNVLPKIEFRLPWVPEKFATVPLSIYANLFGDAGYVVDDQFSRNNSLRNEWQYGYGAGLDIATYYDIVVRLEYAINKFGESGFFLHFSAPI